MFYLVDVCLCTIIQVNKVTDYSVMVTVLVGRAEANMYATHFLLLLRLLHICDLLSDSQGVWNGKQNFSDLSCLTSCTLFITEL